MGPRCKGLLQLEGNKRSKRSGTGDRTRDPPPARASSLPSRYAFLHANNESSPIYSVCRGLGLLGHAIKYQAFLILPLFFLLYLFIRHHQTGQEPIGCYKVDTNEKCDPLRKKKIPEIWALRRLSVQVNGVKIFFSLKT